MKRYSVCLLGLLGAALCHGVTIEQYHAHDFAFSASVSGNPFDAELKAEFQGPGGVRISVPGFYDGNGVWKIRFSPTVPGRWSLRTTSSAPALNGRPRRISSASRTATRPFTAAFSSILSIRTISCIRMERATS